MKNFKSSFEALVKDVPEQKRLRTHLMDAFARRFPSCHLHSVVDLIEDSQDFLRELLLAMAETIFKLEGRSTPRFRRLDGVYHAGGVDPDDFSDFSRSDFGG